MEDEEVEKFEVQVEQQAEDEDMPKKPKFSDKASVEGKWSYTPAHTLV